MIYMYSIHIRNADIVLICVYMYNIYTVFLLLFITVFLLNYFIIVKLNINFVYYQFYLLCTNKDYYYYYNVLLLYILLYPIGVCMIINKKK